MKNIFEPVKNCVTFQFANFGNKDKECSWECLGYYNKNNLANQLKNYTNLITTITLRNRVVQIKSLC